MNVFTRARFALRPRAWMVLTLGWLLGVGLPAADAYVLEGVRWPDGQNIVLGLQLGSPKGTLIDGSTSWDEVFTDATDIWNPYLGSGVQFTTQETHTNPAQGDGKNTVFFSGSVFGEAFGDDTLATTAYLYNTNTNVTTEADVVFNFAISYNSYRGPLRANGAATVYDLRRTALHELGHVLGLAHVPQSTQAIMTPDVTDIDTIQGDDIAGVESIYGNPHPVIPVIKGSLSGGGLIGYEFEYLIYAIDRPTSYSASGLPPGLSLNTATGFITGTPTRVGTYAVSIGATNAAGTARATLQLVFSEKIQITGKLHHLAYVGSPYDYQVVTTGLPTSFQSINGGLPAGLSLDPSTGFISGTPTTAGDFLFQVEAEGPSGSDEETFELVIAYDATLSLVKKVSETTALLLASDGNLYGTTSFAGGTVFRLAPGGALTTLYSFDSTGPYAPGDLHEAPDGSFYGTTTLGGANYAGAIFEMTAAGTLTTLVNFPPLPDVTTPTSNFPLPPDTNTTPTVLLASDGDYYASVRPYIYSNPDPGGWIYKVAPDGTLTTLYAFNGSDGFYPSALIQASDGNFYGTAYKGGSNNLGIVFKLTPDGTLTTLHSFDATEGTLPLTPLIQASDGNFYGTTSAGGAGNGTVFKMTPDGTLTTIYTMPGGQGNTLTTGLVQGSDGDFYGVASNVNADLSDGYPNSILFKMTPDGTVTTLHTFADDEGIPAAIPLVPDGVGNFYGAAENVSAAGTIFKETPTAVPLVYAPPTVPTATLVATVPRVSVGGGGSGEFTVSLSAAQSTNVTVDYAIKGSAVNGRDYVLLTGTKKIKAGKTSQTIAIIPEGNLGGMNNKKVDLVLQPGKGYTVGTIGKVKVAIVAGQ